MIARTSGWRDMTAEVEAREALEESQRALHFLATHDPLTGLVNRRELVTRLEELLAGSDATPPVTTLPHRPRQPEDDQRHPRPRGG